jgi:GrpB-like predicted nucleotidyltransferase (UPF0157 family)
MANISELSARLLKRFKNVPNVTADDTTDWTEEAMLAHGYDSSATVPTDKETLILLAAQAEGAQQISIATAHFFSYTDGEESIDKTMISEQYRKLAKDLRDQYARAKAESSTAFHAIKRADRP